MFMSYFWVGLIIVVTLSSAMLYLLTHLLKLRAQQQQLHSDKKELESRLKSLESKVNFLNTGSLGIGQRLMSAEKRLNQAVEKQNEMFQGDREQLFQKQANRVLKGKQVPDDASTTLSRSEVKLMALVGKTETGDN